MCTMQYASQLIYQYWILDTHFEILHTNWAHRLKKMYVNKLQADNKWRTNRSAKCFSISMLKIFSASHIDLQSDKWPQTPKCFVRRYLEKLLNSFNTLELL